MAAHNSTGPYRVLVSLVTTNFWSKVLALLCAIMLWFYLKDQIVKVVPYEFTVSSEKPGEQTNWIVIPTLSDWIIIPDQDSTTVEVTFRGPTEEFRDLRFIEGSIEDSLFELAPEVDESTVKIQINDIDFGVRSGITAESAGRPDLEFRVMRRISRQLTVDVKLKDYKHPDTNYTIGSIIVRPSTVLVTGPRTFLADRETIELAPLEIARGETTMVSRTGVLPEEVRKLGVQLLERVNIEIPIEPALTQREVSVSVMIQAPFEDLRLPDGKSLADLLVLGARTNTTITDEGRFKIRLEGPVSAFTAAAMETIQRPGVFYVELSRDDIVKIQNGTFLGTYPVLHHTDLLPADISFYGERPELTLEPALEDTE